MSPARAAAYLGLLVGSALWAGIGAARLLEAPHEGDRAAAWFWAGIYAAAALATDLCFWELF